MRGPLIAFVASITMVVASCASINADRLPQPGESYSDGYDITLQFESVLNLPDRAKVVMDGTKVGIVRQVELATDQVDVTARIDPSVAVPQNIRASLQQATVLGDIYIALDRPPSNEPAVPPLRPNDTVPLAHTVSPPQVEDTIVTLSNFISSGSIQRVQNSIVGINRVTPQGDSARLIASQVAADLRDLSEGIETVDVWLEGVANTGEVLHRQIPALQKMVSPWGMRSLDRLTINGEYVGVLLPSVGSLYSNGYWLVPLLESLSDAVGAMQRDKQAFEHEVPAWRELFYERFLSQDKYPAMNITSIMGPDGREISGGVQDVLRIMGAAP